MIPGLTWQRISFEPTNEPTLTPFTESLDLMGDGSLTLLPTPGHTAGSISLLVRRRTRPPLLLVSGCRSGHPAGARPDRGPASARQRTVRRSVK
jgi:glyoxylase-like metal-dependent hydrolase (beta-lactamase superfamily II)